MIAALIELFINVIRVFAPIAGVVCFFLDLPIVVYIAGAIGALSTAFRFLTSRGLLLTVMYGICLFGLPFVVMLIFQTPWILSLCFLSCVAHVVGMIVYWLVVAIYLCRYGRKSDD